MAHKHILRTSNGERLTCWVFTMIMQLKHSGLVQEQIQIAAGWRHSGLAQEQIQIAAGWRHSGLVQEQIQIAAGWKHSGLAQEQFQIAAGWRHSALVQEQFQIAAGWRECPKSLCHTTSAGCYMDCLMNLLQI